MGTLWTRFVQKLFPPRPHIPERAPESRHYPLMLQLVHAYFNQDYDIISGTADDVLREYREYTSTVERQALIAEIEDFLARYNTGPEELSRNYNRILTPDAHFEAEWGLPLDQALRRVIEQLSDDEASLPG